MLDMTFPLEEWPRLLEQRAVGYLHASHATAASPESRSFRCLFYLVFILRQGLTTVLRLALSSLDNLGRN